MFVGVGRRDGKSAEVGEVTVGGVRGVGGWGIPRGWEDGEEAMVSKCVKDMRSSSSSSFVPPEPSGTWRKYANS